MLGTSWGKVTNYQNYLNTQRLFHAFIYAHTFFEIRQVCLAFSSPFFKDDIMCVIDNNNTIEFYFRK